MQDLKVIEGSLKGQSLENLESKILIKGDVIACNISSNDFVEIKGDFIDSTLQVNSSGSYIRGNIKSSKIRVFGDLRGENSEESEIVSSHGAVYIKNRVSRSIIKAMSFVHIEDDNGEITGSSLSASIEVSASKVGRFGNTRKTVLCLFPRRKQDMFELFFVYKQKLGEKEQKLKSLTRYIKVFSLIKDKVHSLPEAKKNELLKKIKEYNILKKEVENIKQEKYRMFLRNPEEDRYNRAILVRKNLYPPVEVEIDEKSMEIETLEEKLGFYRSGIIIKGELDKIYKKRKIIAVIN